jgi:FkbM family methyltransferase
VSNVEDSAILAHANGLLVEGEYLAARDYLEQTIRLGHASWEFHWALARAAKELGDVALVDRECQIVLAADPKFWFAQELPKHVRGYYGQVEQDKVIEQFFQKYPAENSFFVEVGAFDGVNFSNVRRLHEKYGWTGLCVEPVRKNFERLQKSYRGTSVRCVRSAVSTEEGEVEIAVSTYPHLPDWGSDTATLNPAEMDRWNYLNTQWTKEKTPLRTLTSILDEQGITAFDVLSIDTEGNDLEVLKSLDFSRFHPALIVVEYFGTPPEVFAGYLRDKGYTILHDNGQDVFLQYSAAVRRSKEDKEARSPSSVTLSPSHAAQVDSPSVATSSQTHIPITYLMGVYNEEARIRTVLEHATRWADEVVIINKSSTDRTKEICLEYGEKVKIIDIPLTPKGQDDIVSFIKLASHDWVYVGTASEVPTRALINKCRQALSDTHGQLDLVYVPRRIYSFGIHATQSPWSLSYYPFLLNRRRAIITNTIHYNFKPRDPNNAVRIPYADDCCVYHLTHATAKEYMQTVSDYFEAEAASCTDVDAKIHECFVNIANYEEQLRSGGEDLRGHYFAWPIYWMGTALFLWEKKRGLDVKAYYRTLASDVLRKEWLVEERPETLLWNPSKPVATEDDLLRELHGRPIASEIKTLYVIGAHRFQERDLFDRLFPHLEHIYLFEPLPAFYAHLKKTLASDARISVFPYAITDSDGQAKFHVTNNDGASSSLLPLAGHKQLFPHVQVHDTITVQTRTLDSVIAEHGLSEPDMLMLDVQGAEFAVVSSLSSSVRSRARLIYTEASKEELYQGARVLDDVASVLAPQFVFLGFAPLANYTPTHGNALFANQRDLSLLARPSVQDVSPSPRQMDADTGENGYLVSAIVSAYKSERFIRGCLEDLEAQTIADRLEIVVVDTGSPQNEREVVEEFQRRYDNIVYIRTEKREGVYTAWNRGIRAARGKYVTSANTDDRHRADYLEQMVSVLEAKTDVALVYANVHITEIENETFANCTISGRYRWIDFDPLLLTRGCFIGPQPMWRKSIHNRYGYFDDSFESAGDWEFWLRIAETETFYHLDEFLGLYLKSPTSAEHRDIPLSQREAERIRRMYLPRAKRLEALVSEAQASKGLTGGNSPIYPKSASALVRAMSADANALWSSLGTSTTRELAISIVGDESSVAATRPDQRTIHGNWRVTSSGLSVLAQLNRTIQEPGDDPIFLLSSDQVLTPEALDRMADVLQRDQKAAIVGPFSNCAPLPQQVAAKYKGTGKEMRRFAHRRAQQYEGQSEEVRYLGGFCMALNRVLCREIGPVREDVEPEVALWDYFTRIRQAGMHLTIARDAYVHHDRLDVCEGAVFDDLAAAEDAVSEMMAAGEAALEQGDLETAVSEFTRVTESHHDLAAGHVALGSTLMAMGKTEDAIHAIERAITLTPQAASLHNQLGVALFQIDNLDGAEAAFREARKADPEDVQPLLNLIDLYRSQERYVEATQAVKEAVQLNPGHPEVIVTFGSLSLELGDLEGAKMALDRLQAISPDHLACAPLREAVEQATSSAMNQTLAAAVL